MIRLSPDNWLTALRLSTARRQVSTDCRSCSATGSAIAIHYPSPPPPIAVRSTGDDRISDVVVAPNGLSLSISASN